MIEAHDLESDLRQNGSEIGPVSDVHVHLDAV